MSKFQRLVTAICFGVAAAASLQSSFSEAAEQAKFVRGDTPPKTLGLSRDGEIVETTQFAGKVLVVTFWATWCAPCRAEMKYLEALQRKVSKEILQVVAVNIEEREIYREAMRKLSDFQILIANDRSKQYSNAYGVNGIPHMVIIGKDGKVANVHRGYSEDSIPGLAKEIVEQLYVGVKQVKEQG